MPQSLKPEQMPQQKTQLAESDEAVFNLLESLLQEVEDLPEEPDETKVTETVSQPVITEAVKISTPAPIVKTEVAVEAEPEIFDDLPEWTRQPISCLLFEVEGIEIAVPLSVLRSIDVWDKPALPIPTQPQWHLGVIQHREGNVVIVDTARLIMPEKVSADAEQRRQDHASHYLVIDDKWALSCDGIHETIKIAPDQVRWRPQRPSRPWAVGTLIDRLCVLMDTQALINQIETSQERR